MKKPGIIFAIILLVLLGLFSGGQAQYYFGKNKIQYTNFQWQVMKTEHFEIYFYLSERELAETAAAMAERSYRELAAKFHHLLSRPVPLILYSNHNHFQQTNTIPYMLPEGVSGFMEFMKGRVVIPFDGSHADLDRVIRHELVHVFTMAKLRTVLRDHDKYQYHPLPLWMIEGLAEYWSRRWDADAEMVMRDAVVSGNLVPLSQIYRIYGTFQLYKEGQSALAFISQRYGEDKILRLMENWWKTKKFRDALEITLGASLKEVDQEWQYSLKKRYYPLLKNYDMPQQAAEKLTSVGSNVKPAVCPAVGEEGEGVVFMSNRMGYVAVYQLITREGESLERRLIRGERTAEFEALHLLRSKLDVSADGQLAFVSKSQETDVLYLWDMRTAKVIKKFQFPHLVSLFSPSWSRGGDRIALCGADRQGHVDLYLVDVQSGELRQLTADLYDDRDPSWSADDRHLVFSSDRSPNGQEGYHNLYLYRVQDGKLEQLTEGAHNDYAPSWAPTGDDIVFSSDRGGVYNLYILQAGHENRRLHQLTSMLTGAFDPDWSVDGRQIVFSAYEDRRFQIYRLNAPDSLGPGVLAATTGEEEPWRPMKLAAPQAPSAARYRKKLSLDIAQSAVSYDPVFGVGGGLQVALTDMLGDHQYYFLVNNTASDRRDFLSSFNFGFSYFNLSQRTNLGGGAFHFVDDYFDDYRGWYFERQYGGFMAISHPFSKFDRVELSTFLKHSDKENYDTGKSRSVILSSTYLSFIKDTSLWGPVGPVDGVRTNLSVGITWAPWSGRVFSRTIRGDFRQYFRISRRICHALRLVGRYSQGLEPQIFYMGGSWDMRGYSRRHFMGRKLILVNNELRLPVIDNLLVGFPFGNMELRAIRGALFLDVGNAWDENLGLAKELSQVHGSFGLGLRARVGYFTVLRLDFAKTTDFKTIFPETKVQFFFGWSY
jgi:dipeptidyl aminopeptidase/acylaminoacyl peptidase